MSVIWLIDASESLRAATDSTQYDVGGFDQLREAFSRALAQAFAGQVVIVRERLSGYRDFYGVGVFLIEVQPAEPAANRSGTFHSPAVYIVKTAIETERNELAKELDAWDNCHPKHITGNNIFMSLDPFPPRGQGVPLVLVYESAETALGSRNVVPLEEALTRFCRFGKPEFGSIVTQLNVLYDRLGTYLFSYSKLYSSRSYLTDDTGPKLFKYLLQWREPPAPNGYDPLADARQAQAASDDPANAGRSDRITPAATQQLHGLRRRVLALMADRHEAYADPIDALTGFRELRNEEQDLPEVLRGRAHGDLHARNMEVAIDQEQVSSCALFDYESMKPDNIVAWDFIKLEVELAVRVLAAEAAQNQMPFMEQCLTYWRYVAARVEDSDNDVTVVEGDDAILLRLQTVAKLDTALAGAVGRLPEPILRLADIAVTVRRIAKKHLRGGFDWIRQYDLMLAWYGMRAGLYPNYSQETNWIVAALLGAGVAARRLIGSRTAATSGERPLGETSHRPRFLHARKLVRSGDPAQLQQGIEELRILAAEYVHVLEVYEELSLALFDSNQLDAAERVLDSIGDRYRSITEEFPARFGSLWKRRATAEEPVNVAALEKSLEHYSRAEAIEHGYFPAINVAALHCLMGKPAKARAKAEAVLKMLDAIELHDDPFWPHATRGEAMLLCGADPIDALACYELAVSHRDCTPRDRRSMRRQLKWLKPHLEQAAHAALDDATLDRIFRLTMNESFR